jgi:hypothetical protein
MNAMLQVPIKYFYVSVRMNCMNRFDLASQYTMHRHYFTGFGKIQNTCGHSNKLKALNNLITHKTTVNIKPCNTDTKLLLILYYIEVQYNTETAYIRASFPKDLFVELKMKRKYYR